MFIRRQAMLLPQLFLLTILGMLPTTPRLLLLIIFAMPLAIAVSGIIGAAAERQRPKY
jgi:hypothetical protein